MTKRWFIGALIIVAATGSLLAADFRNIASFSVENNFDGSFETRLENVFLAPLVPERALLQVKLRNEVGNRFGEARSLTMAHLGPVLLLSPSLYSIISYGAGFRESGSLVHEGDLQLHYETVRYRLGGGFRGRLEPSDDVSYVVGSLGGRIAFPRGFGVQATWYTGLDNDGDLSHSTWVEGDYAVSDAVAVKLGGTVDLGDGAGWADGSDTTYSLITGAAFRPSEVVTFRYQFDFIIRPDADNGVRNLLLVDWRF